MRRRIPVQDLRGSNLTLLEVQLQDLLLRPMGQLAPENVLDLLALAESPERPKSLASSLDQFVERCSKEVADLPSGSSFEEFLDEFQSVPGQRVPNVFRGWLTREADRDDRDEARIQGVIEVWSGAAPEPFQFGENEAQIERSASSSRSQAARSKPATTRRSSAANRRAVPKPESNEDSAAKRGAISRLCLERLGSSSEKGLAEPVLVAGIRHRCKSLGLGAVSPAEVTSVLRQLKTEERVRYSAGRWMANTHW